MKTRFHIRSQRGNLAVGVITGIEAILAIVLLAAFVIESWDYATLTMRIFQIVLALFAGIAAHIASGAINESLRSRDRRASAATSR